jgi:hypothetical protein
MSHPGHFTLLQCFAYWTSCAIATFEVADSKKKTSASERTRLHSIAKQMLEDLRIHTPPDDENPKAKKDYEDCVERLARAEASSREKERPNEAL